MKVAEAASKSFLLQAEPVLIDPETIYGAMVLADSYCDETCDCDDDCHCECCD